MARRESPARQLSDSHLLMRLILLFILFTLLPVSLELRRRL
jgi:hypothetical protein